jgi:energy-coupling factor transporter ATP-binding protein EcfA2
MSDNPVSAPDADVEFDDPEAAELVERFSPAADAAVKNSIFQPARLEAFKLKLGIAGPSGSGKTTTSLMWATVFAGDSGRIAVLDTEHGSSKKCADRFSFEVHEMYAPYKPSKFIKRICDADRLGYDVLIIDSLSHAWAGQGGMLESVDKLAAAKYRGNKWAAWNEGTPIQHELVETLLAADLHIIVTMRSKSEWVVHENGDGRTRPEKIGLAPVQRDGLDYEFDLMFMQDLSHGVSVDKTRCRFIDACLYFPEPDERLARLMLQWANAEEPDREVLEALSL